MTGAQVDERGSGVSWCSSVPRGSSEGTGGAESSRREVRVSYYTRWVHHRPGCRYGWVVRREGTRDGTDVGVWHVRLGPGPEEPRVHRPHVRPQKSRVQYVVLGGARAAHVLQYEQ